MRSQTPWGVEAWWVRSQVLKAEAVGKRTASVWTGDDDEEEDGDGLADGFGRRGMAVGVDGAALV